MSEDEGFRRGARPRSDSSSSDGSVGPSNSRNKRLRVAIESDGSDSSGGPVPRRGRRRAAPLRDSDTDTSGWATDHSDAPLNTAPPRNDGFASDSSEGNSDKCTICLLQFTNQEIGTPQSCEHYFCLDCITEWSRNVNTCPVDRITFDAIVVKSCLGGTVLRTEPVKGAESGRSSIDIVVVEEHTVCELCNSAEGEDTMLLCDGCDLGFHMACLEPPLITIPRGQWFCPNCISDNESVSISEVTDLLDELDDAGLAARPLPPRSHVLRAPRNVRRSRRNRGADQPSSSRQGNSNITSEGSTSRSRKSRSTRQRVRVRRSRRDPSMLEYEVGSGGQKTKRKPNKKKRKSRRQPRTAARLAQVRSCVRARLATLRDHNVLRLDATDYNVSRHRAGIQPLSIFGSAYELDYYGDEEEDGGGGGTVAMATRPTSHIISAYRQAQRKQITIPSPTHASTAPDILSSILESQSLLHSKGSIVSVSAGGQVNIKVLQKIRSKNPGSIQPNVCKPTENKPITSKDVAHTSGSKVDNREDINKGVSDRVDLNKESSSVSVKETPMHPSQSRGGGFSQQNNYRGHGNFNNGGRHYDNNYGGESNRNNNNQGNSFQGNVYNDGNSFEGNYDRRPFDGGFRPRRPNFEENRPFQRFNEPGRHSFGPPWQTSNQNRNQYQNNPRPSIEPRARHSFGGFEDPLDMRTGPNNFQPSSSNNIAVINTSNNSAPAFTPTNTNIPPLREPPAFKFNANNEVEKSEDENDGLVIDTEKYDPTEPTVDEESGNEDEQTDLFPDQPEDVTESITESIPESIPLPQGPVPTENLDKPMNISAAALDDAVRQVISQHSSLLTNVQDSEEEDTGDCPNFSIYSATSVHIAQTTNIDETPSIETATVASAAEVKKPADAYNEKISKKCPITTNTRTPIKIKLNTPSLIKRVNLYDEEEDQQEEEVEETPKLIESTVEDIPVNKNNYLPVTDEVTAPDEEMDNVKAKSVEREKSPEKIIQSLQIYDDDDQSDRTPIEDEKDSPIIENTLSNNDEYFKTPDRDDPPSDDEKSIISNKSTKSKRTLSESDQGEQSDSRLKTPKKKSPLEKMTESISETEDERSYTPCLDENKKEASVEGDALQGLDTELISEDEAQDTFPETPQEAEVTEEAPKPEEKEASVKKKKIKEKKSKKKSESFKKSGKTKTRNYRDKDKNRSRSPSHDKGDKGKSKREKRKDLERYDVRNVVSEKRRRKDAFGRDIISPRASGSPVSPTRKRRSTSPVRRSLSRPKRSVSRPRRSTSRVRRSNSRSRRSMSRSKRSLSPRPRRSPIRAGRSISRHRSISRLKRSLSRQIRSLSRQRRSLSRKRVTPPPRRHSPPFRRRSMSRHGRLSPASRHGRLSPASRHKRRRSRDASPHKRRISLASPPRSPLRKKKKSISPRRKSLTRKEKRRKETEAKTKPSKKKKRDRSQSKEKKRRNRKKSESPKRKSPKRKKKRRSVSQEPVVEVEPEWVWSGGSVRSERSESRPPSPLTPPNPAPPQHVHHRHRRVRDPPPSKEVFTSGDNILVSVSFKECGGVSAGAGGERARRRLRRRRASTTTSQARALHDAKPVAIIDLERSPFREITPDPVNVIVVSDGEKSPDERREPVGPKTPPESVSGLVGPGATLPAPALSPPAPPPGAAPPAATAAAVNAQYDPFEPTRSPSNSSNAGDKEVSCPTETGLGAGPPEPDRLAITLETAQKTNMSADDVLDQRPISPIEKVMALLNSTRDVSLECVPTSSPPVLPATPPSNPPSTPAPLTTTPAPLTPAPAPRVLLPSPTRSSPLRPSKLFLAKPSPIKSTPIKPMPATKISSLPLPAVRRVGEDSPYSPASSDFGELFSPPGGGGGGGGKDMFDALMPRKRKSDASKVPVKRVKKKGGKHQVPVQLDENNLKILDDLPSSAVEMQVKSKYLKKLNRQERVVEEVKLVLKPYYNRRRLSKEDYKDIMRRAVPKICHNKHGEINPTKIQSLVEAYVKKLRKKRKLGLS